MNQRRWTVILVVAITLCLAGGVLTLLDGSWLSAVSALFSATIGVLLLRQLRRPGWKPSRPLPRWRLVTLWVFALVISTMFAVAAFSTSHTERRWIAVVLILFMLSAGIAGTMAFRRIAASAGRPG